MNHGLENCREWQAALTAWVREGGVGDAPEQFAGMRWTVPPKQEFDPAA